MKAVHALILAVLTAACSRDASRVATLAAATLRHVVAGDSAVVVRRLAIDTGQIQMFDEAPSPDGRFVSGLDIKTGNVAMRDLRTGEKRLVTTEANWNGTPDSEAEQTRVSPDGRLIAYAWSLGGPVYDYELRVIGTDGKGMRTLLRTNATVSEAYASDWTPDSRSILTFIYPKDHSTQLALVSAADGSVRVVKSFDWRSPVNAKVSPDGEWLAYDFQPDQARSDRDIFVLQTQGSRETRITSDGTRKFLVGWSGDGAGLFYSTISNKATAIWFVPVRDGRPSRSAQLVRSDLWRAGPIGIALGALYYVVSDDQSHLYSVAIDVGAGRTVGPPSELASGNSMASPPLWSPDGSRVVYVAGHAGTSAATQNLLTIRDVITGEERIVPVPLHYARLEGWFPGSQSLLVRASNRGRDERYRVDLTSAKAELVEVVDGSESVTLSSDGRTEYVARNPGRDRFADSGRVVAREIGSGRERELYHGRRVFGPRLSPDGHQLAFVTAAGGQEAKANLVSIMVMPASGGEARAVLARTTIGGESVNWTRDGTHLLFREFLPGGGEEALSLLSLATGEVRRLLTAKTSFVGPRLSPDDSRVVYNSGFGGHRRELFVMESIPGSRAKP